MSEPFLAEVRIVGFNFAPRGWAMCDGQILPINQNQSLYSLLGTTYGGDGRTSFALPDLRSRVPIHEGEGHRLGKRGGEETHALTVAEIPAHKHEIKASTDTSTDSSPAGDVLATSSDDTYHENTNRVNMASGVLANAGGGQNHDNMQPFLVVNFIIALQGLFPSRN